MMRGVFLALVAFGFATATYWGLAALSYSFGFSSSLFAWGVEAPSSIAVQVLLCWRWKIGIFEREKKRLHFSDWEDRDFDPSEALP